jgi:hypothetical protein
VRALDTDVDTASARIGALLSARPQASETARAGGLFELVTEEALRGDTDDCGVTAAACTLSLSFVCVLLRVSGVSEVLSWQPYTLG